ncbi:DUF2345 domain-containing protein, partial [Curvibacter sp. CHRR-16]|uniref:DUF2345 domain-containing protein n=1 Tax=Curvibacter sp. CHRR-16 TaxID=2835872 RepID=UPI001BDA59F5
TNNSKHPELSEPHLVLASPAGIESTTTGSTHQHSNEHHAITAGGHVSVSTAKSWLLSAKEAIKLFAYKAGIKLVSAKEDIDIQALQKSVNLLAKMDISVTGNVITLTAGDKLTINGAGSQTVWSAAGIHSTTAGSHMAYAGNHDQPKGKTQAVSLPSLPFVPENLPKQYSARLNLAAALGLDANTRQVEVSAPVRAYNAAGELIAAGGLDAKGNTPTIFANKAEKLRIVVGDGKWSKTQDTQHG